MKELTALLIYGAACLVSGFVSGFMTAKNESRWWNNPMFCWIIVTVIWMLVSMWIFL